MEGQEVVRLSSEVDVKTLIEAKLQDSLVHIYDSTRLANDIKNLNTKLESLMAIRNQLTKDSNNPAPALLHMNEELQRNVKNIETKQAEMQTAEKQAIEGFQVILQFLMEKSGQDITAAKNFMAVTLKKFGIALTKGFEDKMTDVKQHLLEIDETKMDRSEKAEIQGTIDAFKSHIIDLQKSQIESIKIATAKQYTALTTHFSQRFEGVDPEKIAKRVQQQVIENIDSKFKQQMQDLQVANTKFATTQENNGNISDKIAQSVKDQVKAHLTPDALKAIISTLPEYQALQSLRPEQAPLSEAIKKIITDLQQEVNDLKTQSLSTRALVNNLVGRNVSPTDKEAVDAQHSAALTQIEVMQKNIQLMHNNMKMMETVMSVQVKRVEESAAQSGALASSRKRPRTDDDSEMVEQKQGHSNEEVLARVADMETRHQKLLDFLLQFKDTVLSETFPDRLSGAFKKFQDIMLNHQTFIAFLVDPFTTGKSVKSNESTFIPQPSSANSSTPVLNPAMLDAISLLVKQTAEEISAPLKEKIKALEDKLNARQQ